MNLITELFTARICPKFVLVGFRFGIRVVLPVEQVLDVDPELERPAAAQTECASDVRVHKRRVEATNAIDSEWEHPLLEARWLIGRIPLEPRVDVEPGLRGVERAVGPKRNLRLVLLDVLEVAIEEELLFHLSSAPGWYSAAPPSVHPCAMLASAPPFARNRLSRPKGSSYTAVPVTRHGRPLLFVCHSVGSRSYSWTVRFSVTRFAVNAAFAGQAAGVAPCHDQLERVGLDHPQRLIFDAQTVVRIAHVRERAQQPVPRDRGRREERVRGQPRVQRRIARLQRRVVGDVERVRHVRGEKIVRAWYRGRSRRSNTPRAESPGG